MVRFLFVSLLLTLHLFALEASSITQNTEVKKFIQVSDISSSATQTITDLKASSKLMESQDEILKISAELEAFIKSTNKLLHETQSIHPEQLPVKELSFREQEHKTRINQLRKWNSNLEVRTKDFDKNRVYLDSLIELWEETLQNAKKENTPKLVVQNVLNVISNAKELQKKSKARYNKILTDSNLINQKLLEFRESLDKIQMTKQNIANNVFQKNTLSFFVLWNENNLSSLEYFKSAFFEMKSEFLGFFDFYTFKDKRIFLFAFYSTFILAFVFYLHSLYKQRRLFTTEESYDSPQYFFIALPLSTSVLLVSLLNYFMFSDIPTSLKELQLLIVVIPLFFIIKKSVPKRLDKYFYLFITLYALSVLEKYASGFALDSRLVSILVSLSLAIYIFFVIKNSAFILFFTESTLKYANAALTLVLVMLGISIFCDFYGATLLASKITSGILLLFYSALIFYVFSMILRAYTIILLRRRIASVSQQVERFTSGVERSMTLFIKVFMILWFLKIFLSALGVWTYMIDLKNFLITLSWHVGEATISIESTFNFVMIIFVTWFVVRLVNIILEVEVFSRFSFSRGIPTAIETTLNYTLITVGLLFALSSLGITVEQFALIFGALGVGIGFGVRNIVANFISGIIMVYERPVQIGDTIVINNTLGKVQSIKMRSSIIKTPDGSEVIIPNADFIEKEITNWTLSDEKRRKTLTFRVDIQSDIDSVLEMMKSVALSHESVLKDPEPVAALLLFSEYYLEFKLYFWLSENIIITQSDVAVNIFKALKENGIKMPTPKHEIQKLKEEV